MTTMSSTSPVQLQIQNIFGVRSKLTSSLFFSDDHTVIYPAGNQFVLVDVETKSQRIFRCNELEHIDTCLVHTGAALLAVVATSMSLDKKQTTISFYDLHTTIGKRKRMFKLNDTSTKTVSMAFSHDAKHLAILEYQNREYKLSLLLYQKSHLISTKPVQPDSGIVLSQVLFHPTDPNLISVIGRRYYRLFRYKDADLRMQSSSNKLDQYDFISHAWYSSNRFLAGTRNGYVYLLHNGDIQTEIDVSGGRERLSGTVPRATSSISSGVKSNERSGLHQYQQEHLDTTRATDDEVISINVISKGFFCLIGGKRLCLYSKLSDGWDFAKAREYVIPSSDVDTVRSSVSYSLQSQTSSDKQQSINNHNMWKIAVSPNEEHVLVLTNYQQIYAVSDLTKDQTSESKETFSLEFIFNSYHHSSIRGLDIAVQKPLFISSGDDHTIRLWDYETNTIEQMKSYNEPVYAISVHPSGHQIVVAFASKVCLMNVLIDGFSIVKEYPIHAAYEIKFCNGGHLFAVIDSNIIQIISLIHLKVVHRLNHGQTIKKILWKKDNRELYSQSSNYFVTWNLENEKKIFELKPTYRLDGGFTVDREDKYLYLASDDGFIRTVRGREVIHDVKLPQEDRPSCLEIFPSNGALLCGTHRGSIYVIKTPLSKAPNTIFHYLAHSARITHISIAFHEALIITSCEDGILMLWQTQIKSAVTSDDWTPFVLHDKARFLYLSDTIRKLKNEVEELILGQDNQIRQKEATHVAELQRRFDMSETERSHHEYQIEHQKVEKEKQQRDFEFKYADLIEKFENDKQNIEEEDRGNMERELRKEEDLVRLSQKMMEDNEFRLRTIAEANENEKRDVTEYFIGRIHETENELAAVREKARHQHISNEIERKNLEADADDEQFKIQLDFENKRSEIIKTNKQLEKKLRETLLSQEKNLITKQNELNETVKEIENNKKEHQARAAGMKDEIDSLLKDLQERNQTINDKMNRLNELELKNQELEKFKYVLNYKIDELDRLIRPRQEEIERMKNQLLEMASEKEKKAIELARNRFQNLAMNQTLHAIDTEVEYERKKRKEYDYAMRRIKSDILAYFADVNDPKRVKKAVAHLYEKYVQNENVKSIYATSDLNSGVSEELLTQNRQRLFLERTTASLKTKLTSDLHTTKANRINIMNENSLLLQELNSLREELKIVRGKIEDYEIAKKTFDERGGHSIDTLIQTLNADAGNYVTRLRDNELQKEFDKNQKEIIRLRQHLARLQANYYTSDQLIRDGTIHDEAENVSIIKLA